VREIIIKAFGYFEPAAEECLEELHRLCEAWYLDMQVFTLDKGTLHIYHEGEYFPDDEVSAILAKHITEKSQGKLDIIDYEAWKLHRYFLQMQYQRKEDLAKGIVYSRSSSLDYALEASMQKNSQVEIK
jgi:hypothetical protein